VTVLRAAEQMLADRSARAARRSRHSYEGHSAMSAEHTVTFPIANRMFGLDSLAKHLNALVNEGQIRDWHPGRWVDWGHTAISITFDSVEDATLAKTLCLDQT